MILRFTSQAGGIKVWFLLLIIAFAAVFSGCFNPKNQVKVPLLLKVESAEKTDLFNEINRLAAIKSIRAKVDFKFEDNSFAESGIADKYKTADGQVIVQAPGNIYLKIQVPFIGQDIVQMTSDGNNFRVAVIYGVEERYKKFVQGTNAANYAQLQERVQQAVDSGGDQIRAVGAFSSLRPQHFTDALLMRPIQNGENTVYTQSEIYQEEPSDVTGKTRSSLTRVIRGYYLLDELERNAANELVVKRRFWFDRVGTVRLAKQQIFDDKGVLVADMKYGAEQNFGENQTVRMPVRVEVTRPQERYKVSLTYQTPETVVIGQDYKTAVFQLENKWELPEVDLDKQQQSSSAQETGLKP